MNWHAEWWRIAASAVIAAVATVIPAGAGAQTDAARADTSAAVGVWSAVSPDTVTVGDHFISLLRIAAPPGSRIVFHGASITDAMQPVDTVRALRHPEEGRDSGGPGGTAAYRLAAWVADPLPAQRVRVIVVTRGGDSLDYRVPLRLPTVRSVLPAGSTDIEPRPSRGVLPLDRRPVWVWWLAGAAALLAVAGALTWLSRKRPSGEVVPGDPRDDAIAELDEIGRAGDPEWMYRAGSRVARRYLALIRSDLGEEWTTTELLYRLPRSGPTLDRDGIARLLADADRVKFAGSAPSAADAAAFIDSVRCWITDNPPAVRADDAVRRAA
jgi:hypothetical protein